MLHNLFLRYQTCRHFYDANRPHSIPYYNQSMILFFKNLFPKVYLTKFPPKNVTYHFISSSRTETQKVDLKPFLAKGLVNCFPGEKRLCDLFTKDFQDYAIEVPVALTKHNAQWYSSILPVLLRPTQARIHIIYIHLLK